MRSFHRYRWCFRPKERSHITAGRGCLVLEHAWCSGMFFHYYIHLALKLDALSVVGSVPDFRSLGGRGPGAWLANSSVEWSPEEVCGDERCPRDSVEQFGPGSTPHLDCRRVS